jgi:hypothetical protein
MITFFKKVWRKICDCGLWLKKKMIWLISLVVFSVSAATLTADLTTNEISLEKLSTKYEQSVEIKSLYQRDGAILSKTDIKNAELDKYKNEPKDEVEITIGDNTPVQAQTSLLGAILGAGKATTTEFTPSISLKRWNEVSFKITPIGLDKVATKDKTLSFEGDKIKFGTPKMSFEMYEATDTEEGGYKYIWYLNEKPVTNKVEFQIESTGLDFFYQPALNEENTDPSLTCTETQCLNASGTVVMERPENVVGSYAVYHSTKGGMNDINGKDYKVGKAFHIFRPHIIDANGAETWGILHIENGIYSVEIPQDFLDKAVYPIKSNDTFGFGEIGGTGVADSWLRGSVFSAPSAGTVTSITVYDRIGGTGRSIITDTSGYILTNGVAEYGEPRDTYVAHWATGAVSNASISSGDYWILAIGYYFFQCAYDSVTNIGRYDNTNSPITPTNPTDATTTNEKISIYATYTAGGGGTTTPSTSQVIIIE